MLFWVEGGPGRQWEHRQVWGGGQAGEGGRSDQPESAHPGQGHHLSGGEGSPRTLPVRNTTLTALLSIFKLKFIRVHLATGSEMM